MDPCQNSEVASRKLEVTQCSLQKRAYWYYDHLLRACGVKFQTFSRSVIVLIL